MATLQDLVGLSNPQAASPTTSIAQGMQLAGQANQLQAQQDAHAQATDQLDTMKFNKAVTNLGTLARTRSDIAKRMVPKMQEQLTQAGIPVDQGVLESMASDDSYKARFNSISSALQAKATDPETRAQALSAFGDIGEFDKGLSLFEDQTRLQQTVALTAAKANTAETVAGINAKGRVDAAGVASGPGSVRAASAEERANNDYTRAIKDKYEAPLEQAARANEIIGKIQNGDLKSTKTLSADLDAAQASLLGGGRPSTVYGQQAVHMDDLYSRANNTIAFLSSSPQDTQAPAKLDQLKKDISALHDFYAEQHAKQYSSYRKGVPAMFRPALDDRFNQSRENYGLSAVDLDKAGPVGKNMTPDTHPAINYSTAQKNYITAAQGLVNPKTKQPYSMDEILSKMQEKGIQ